MVASVSVKIDAICYPICDIVQYNIVYKYPVFDCLLSITLELQLLCSKPLAKITVYYIWLSFVYLSTYILSRVL